MQTIVEKQQKWLLKKFHTLCTKAGLNEDEKYAVINAYGHQSSKDMSARELEDACTLLEKTTNKEAAEADRWRKRCMAAIGGWLKIIGKEPNVPLIKQIACRASESDSFNNIPLERLRNLYYAFTNKQKDFKGVNQVVKEELEQLSFVN